MELRNPFKKKEKSENEVLLEKQQNYARTNILTESSNKTHVDEEYMLQQKNMLAEIRRWQQDLKPKFQRAFEELSGHTFTKTGEAKKIPYVNPCTSINGAYLLINFCKIHDHNVMRSNYSETRINLNLRYGVGYPLVSLVKQLAKDEEVERKKAIMDMLVHYCFNLVEPTYYHALNDGERRHDSQIYKVVRNENENLQQEKKGLWQSK